MSSSESTLVSADVRRHNLAVIGRYLVDNGPSSRTRIAAGTGLTRGAVTALTTALAEAGILRESEPLPSGGKGRPITLLELAADDVALLALQLDADEATALLVSLAGETLFRTSQHHGRPMGEPGAVLDILARVLQRALDSATRLGRRIADLSVVVFAPVGGDPARVLADTDLGWGAVDVIGGLRDRIAELPADIRLLPDAAVAALAEYSLLPNVSDMLYVKSNSGIGGAFIVGGHLVSGANGLAGMHGHLPIDHDGEACTCGQRGCLVTVAGPDAVLHAAGLGEMLLNDGLTASLAELTHRIQKGEERAVAAWDAAAVWVARTLWILATSLDPEVIILGGYWAELLEPVATAFETNRPTILHAQSWNDVTFVPGRLGNDAALLGAVWSARDRLLRDPLSITI